MRTRIRVVAGGVGAVALLLSGCTSSGIVHSGLGGADRHPSPSSSSPALGGPASPAAPTVPAVSSPAAPLGDVSAGRSNPVRDDTYPQYGDPSADVEHYGLDLRWDPDGRVLTGTATLTVRVAKPTSRFVFDLGAALTVDSLSVDGAPVGSVAAGRAGSGDKLSVPLPGQKPVDAVVTVVVAYHGTPRPVAPPMTRPDITALGASITADGGVWAQQEPYGAFTWFPCDDQPSDKALYDVSITAPDGWAGVTGGSFLGRTESAGRGVYRWHQPSPVATYLVAFSVDRFQQDTATGPHGLPLTFWYLPEQQAAVRRLTARVPGMISFLEARFGPFPFPSAGVLFRPERVGMETTTMITLDPTLPDDDLLHEFAHQWFGDAVTPTTWSGVWLNEGYAMFAQLLWDRDQMAPQSSMDSFMAQFLPQDQALRTADGPPGHFLPTHFASSNVYIPPALMLNKIRDAVGDKEFFALSTDWAHQNFGTNQDRASFVAFVNRHTGRDLTALITSWLDSPTTPTGA